MTQSDQSHAFIDMLEELTKDQIDAAEQFAASGLTNTEEFLKLDAVQDITMRKGAFVRFLAIYGAARFKEASDPTATLEQPRRWQKVL